MLPTTILLALLSAGAIAAPASNSTESPVKKPTTLDDFYKAVLAPKPSGLPVVYANQPPPDPNALTEEEKAHLPTWRCTYDVSYKMLTYYLFGDNWNATKQTIKDACEIHRTMDHWSYNEWKDDEGSHFCAKFNLPMKSTEKLEDRLDKVIAKHNWAPEINCELTKGKNWLNERGHC